MNTVTRAKLVSEGFTTTDELIKAVAEWGEDKGINDHVMQFAKIVEELGELAHEITRSRCGGTDSVPSVETIDSVGDILVTIIIWCNIMDIDPIFCLSVAYNEIRGRTGELKNGSFVKEVL